MVRLGSAEPAKGQRICGECGLAFTPRRHDQVFCSGPCRFEDHNRAMKRGREAYRAMYHWRLTHGKGERGSLIGEVSRMAKEWVAEDKANGRLPPPIPEELVARVQGARLGYVKITGRGYVHDPEAAERVKEELGR